MRRLFASLFSLAFWAASPAFAVMEDYPSVKLQGLDKSVGRTVTFEARVGSTIQYGPLYIKIHSCRKAPPIETPESAAFLQVWEVPPGAQKSEWVFSGWMFASSPALSAMDHPVYDVWVLDCTGREEPNEEAASAQSDEEADQTSLPPAGSAPAVQQQREEDIPEDSEAEPDDAGEMQPQPQPQSGVTVPGQETVQPSQAPAQDDGSAYYYHYQPQPVPQAQGGAGSTTGEPYPTYQAPQEQQPAVNDPSGEGIYSPSQGRIVPVQPQGAYGQ